MRSLLMTFLLLLSPLSVLAEDFDLEFEFGIKEKSTLEDFPMQEIGQEELSDAAIGGALQATSARDAEDSGRPAYAEQRDAENKSKNDRKLQDINSDNENPLDKLAITSPVIPPPRFELPAYQEPNGRTYGGHNVSAFERP